MFNDNVTQTYDYQDASQEIIVMLLGAFLLGCLLTWLLNKLFSKDYVSENGNYLHDNNLNKHNNNHKSALKNTSTKPVDTTSEVRIVDKPTNPIARTIPETDDLTKLSGIDKDTQVELRKYGISSFIGLKDIATKDLRKIQEKRQSQKRVIETWPHQAGLAAKGDWNKLKEYQDFILRAQIASNSSLKGVAIDDQVDDLKIIEGVNEKIEVILNDKNIKSFKQLSHIDSDILKSHLIEADPELEECDTETWSHQAAMAEKGQWEELKIYQGFMDSDGIETATSQRNSNDKVSNSKIASLHVKTVKEEIDQIADDENLSDHDDLKKIEGIGPKIEEILNNGGIYTFSQLYKSDRNRLRKLLDDAGSQFKMHDPNSWPHQAGMANRAEWNDLSSYQTTITQDTDNSIKTNRIGSEKLSLVSDTSSKTKLSSVPKNDDLRKIEGIGPKIEELLNKAGINSFIDLSTNTRDSLKKLLNEAGPQFRMHEPESWPHQAKLAANGEWAELQKYQDFLLGGRE